MAKVRQDSQFIWSKRMARWKSSGLSAEEFAQQEGISAGQLAWWRGRLRTLEAAGTSACPAFVELVGEPAGNGVEVVLRSGAVVRVPVGFDETTVGRLVRVLDGVTS